MIKNRTLPTLIRKDYALSLRGGTLFLLFGITWGLFIVSGVLTLIGYREAQQEREHAARMFRDQWEGQHKGAHDAAHYGTWIFKPLHVLGVFHPGLNDYSGTTYRIEAHKQTEVDHSSAGTRGTVLRLGQFSFALLLQLLVPLLILFLASSSVTTEKASGTLRMLLAQGVTFRKLVWSKTGVHYLYAFFLSLPVFSVMLVIVLYAPEGRAYVLHLLFIFIGYQLYYFLCVLLGVIISVRSAGSGISAFAVLAFWLLSCILFPRVMTNTATHRHPPMSRAAFDDHIIQGYREGLGDDGPYYERAKQYENELLSRYHATRLSEIPVDTDALVMQYHEDYKSRVFTYYYKEISEAFAAQQDFIRKASWADPFIGLKRLTAALSGTDFFHHQAFFTQARAYRNYFIRTLNEEQALHPGQTVPKTGFYAEIRDFEYREPSLGEILGREITAFGSMLVWIVCGIAFLFVATRKSPVL